MLFRQADVAVVAASVDPLDEVRSLAEGLRIRYVQLAGELDGPVVAEATGAKLQTGDRTFLHATGFFLDPSGAVMTSVYSSGPIGRFTATEILKRVAFEKNARARAQS